MIKALADAKVRTQEKKIGFARKRRGVKDPGVDDDETVSSAEPAKPTSARRHRQKRSANGSTGVEPQPFKSDRRTLFETAAIASAPASQKYRADPQILPRVHVERADHLPEASKRSAWKPTSSHSVLGNGGSRDDDREQCIAHRILLAPMPITGRNNMARVHVCTEQLHTRQEILVAASAANRLPAVGRADASSGRDRIVPASAPQLGLTLILAERYSQQARAQEQEAGRRQGKKSVGDNVVVAHDTPTTPDARPN